ncbi:MAG TPA: TraR/DksA C4-type zinc finger protein [Candidatus Paceibacterota bacterium]|jgi:RNA polymerase-binding protein DksA|nr:TraR/DksA C4-type zinc finger protein [Candidatus Paceibacterota bacterium]
MKIVNETKNCYSDSELKEFEKIVLGKIAIAQEELSYLQSLASDPTDDIKKPAESAAEHAERENNLKLADRQKKFIEQLQAALVRIGNKTYGICVETGKLIEAGRLRAVPHTTLSMEAKLKEVA